MKILICCFLLAEYGFLLLLYLGVIGKELFFLRLHGLRESFYVSLLLALGGVLLADAEERRSEG